MTAEIDRSTISAGMERARLELRDLAGRAAPADSRRRTSGTRWTNEQMLFHMVFGYLVVRALIPLVRLFGLLPPGASRAFARVLDAGRVPFNAVNYAGSRGGALVFRGPRLVRRMDKVVTALVRRLERTPDRVLRSGMRFPVSWDPFFRDYMTLEQVYAYPTEHFDFHRQQLTLPE